MRLPKFTLWTAPYFLACVAAFVYGQDKPAATSPMGWNSWNHFAERIDDKTVRETVEHLTVHFSQIGISGEASIRDIWLKKDLGIFEEKYSAYVPAHGVVLIRVKPK
jgi:Alpha galactosidase C-terminal beta sandwich domain